MPVLPTFGFTGKKSGMSKGRGVGKTGDFILQVTREMEGVFLNS